MSDFNNQQNPWNNDFSNGSQQPYQNNQYNNPYNNYQGNMNMNQQNQYNPNGNMGYIPPQPENIGYMPPPKPKTPKLIYIILIAVIIFFAVIIVLMSTSIRAMFNGGDNQQESNEHNNIITTQETTEEPTEEETTEETTTEQTTTTTTTEPIPETVTVTVVVEKEIIKEVEVPVQKDYTTVYSDTYYGYVSTQKDPLNIRSGAGKSYKVLGSVPKGTYIYVNTTSSNGWYYTTYGGVSGYVSADYVTLAMSDAFYGSDPPSDYNSYSYIDVWATVATKSDPLNLRSSPSTSASIITSIPKGTAVYVNYAYDSNWYYITWGQYSGYVSAQFLAFA